MTMLLAHILVLQIACSRLPAVTSVTHSSVTVRGQAPKRRLWL